MKTPSILSMTVLASILTISFSSCKKDEDPINNEYQAKVMLKSGETKDLETVSTTSFTEGTISRDGDVYSLRNFRQFDDADAVLETFYFDFKENDGVAVVDAPLELNAIQRNMDVAANTEKGYTLSYIDKGFESVAKNDAFIALAGNKAGIVTPFSPAGTIGWSNYNMAVHHILAIDDRTFILSKDGVPVFKFRVNSVYSDETPNKPTASDNYVFYSIDYQEFK